GAEGPPVNLAPPAIAGIPRSGQVLSASPGTWTNTPASFNYQWQRCNALGAKCSAIPGATASSLALGGGHVGATLRVSVAAVVAGGDSAPVVPAQTAVVTQPAGQAPVN